MEILPQALESIKNASINGKTLATIFETMATQANLAGGVSNNYTIDYQHPDQKVTSDTWIPQIVLILRPTESSE